MILPVLYMKDKIYLSAVFVIVVFVLLPLLLLFTVSVNHVFIFAK